MSPIRVILLALGLLFSSARALAVDEKVCVIAIRGVIGPATAAYVHRAIDRAADQQAQCLIIQLDTPGGFLDSTKLIVQSLLASPVPTVVYVSPPGATAASAGCFITLASDVAAMAPATSMGAAHPVELSGTPTSDEVSRKKLENYAASYIQAIASRRQRNTEWAISAVRESASIPADQAKDLGVIEIIARDLPDLLAQLDGRTLSGRRLATAHAQIIELPMLLREKSFQLLGRPEVLFVLMLIAVYGIIGELSSPGAILPGVAGAIALILALYLASVVPVNLAGLALVLLAVGLFVADVFATTHGVLTVGGIGSFLLGALMMFDRTDPMLRLSLWLIIPATLLTAAFFAFVVGAGLRAQLLPARTGQEALVGMTASALTSIGPEGGRVMVEGEYWRAVSAHPIEAGRPVCIIAVNGLTLTVEPPGEPSHG